MDTMDIFRIALIVLLTLPIFALGLALLDKILDHALERKREAKKK